jgi:hypothetical protein
LSYDGAIVVNLYERELDNLMNDTVNGRDEYTFIINNKGTVVSHPDKLLITKAWADQKYIAGILHSNTDTGYIIDENKQFLFSYYKSDFNNWILCQLNIHEGTDRKNDGNAQSNYPLTLYSHCTGQFGYLFLLKSDL